LRRRGERGGTAGPKIQRERLYIARPDCAIIHIMQAQSPARRRFRAQIRRPDPQIDLAEAALCIAWEDQGAAEVRKSLHTLDMLAAEFKARTPRASDPHAIVGALNQFLFTELGFHGNTWSYGDPANSFLDRVLETRTGLPITLSLVYIELGARLGLPLVGLALPGHFLVRYAASDGADLYIDPFNRGRLWTRAECEVQIAGFYGAVTPTLFEQVMTPPSKRAFLARMLRNLKSSYAERNDFLRALAATERIVLLEPDNLNELRDRGLLRARAGYLHGALEDLDRYARRAPKASDLPRIREQARALAERLAKDN
ncbi:MAG TPA: transglutaminase-like domain-containing protein, partial [Roseiflexaceae bacterium]|nr:transglutaminase-like domain-containing protein [Roseiflexaceae bacterium]